MNDETTPVHAPPVNPMPVNPMPVHPVAITGMHRSGTSMITRGLHQSGLHLIGGDADALLAAADDNPEGFWENKAIVACNDDLLEAAGGAWDNPPDLLPLAVDDPRLAEVVEPATAALAGLRENEKWGFKDPRTCLTAAFWLDLQPDLRFVICVRNPLEVALSLKRRNQNSYSLGLSLWERYYQSILDLVPPERRIVTHYDTYFLDPDGELRRVCEFVGLEAAELNVRRDLRHHDVGVSLDEANLSSGIRTLYQRLCDEAGAAVPRHGPVDEGQVRRLVLDGTVAARHAEQRQHAVERLEERLTESRQSEKDLEIELAQVRRESAERQARLAELDRLRVDTSDRIDTLIDGQRRLVDTTDTIAEMSAGLQRSSDRLLEGNRLTLDRLAHAEAINESIQVKLRAVEKTATSGFFSSLGRRVLRLLGRSARGVARPTRRVARAGARRGVPAATRTAKSTARRLPTRFQNDLRRVRRAVADGQLGNRVSERANKVVDRLPDPARKVAGKGTAVVKSSGAVPRASRLAHGLGRRLPDPAKQIIRTVIPRPPSTPGTPARAMKKAAPAPRPKQTADGRAAAVPKGPAAFKWQRGYERLISEFVATDTAWVVVTPGSKLAVHKVGVRSGTTFPSLGGEAPAADSLSLIAILEALRVAGNERLVLPEGSRLWFQEHPELRDHVARCHTTLVDREAAGAVFDLRTGAPVERRSLLAEVDAVGAVLPDAPAVLDWTGLGIARELPGVTTFEPRASRSLPYFDKSIEIVVTTAAHDRAEAVRVSSVAVIIVAVENDQFVVLETLSDADDPPGAPHIVVYAPPTDDTGLEAALVARVAECGATLVFGPASSVDGDVVVMLESGVLPLPGAIAVAAAAVMAEPDTVAVAKVIDHHGRVESAGGMVFADGTVAGIAAGTLAVRAPWHEFVRPVCWGGGMVAASTATLAAVEAPADQHLADWCGAVWAGGCTVRYHPKAAVVRTTTAGVSAPRAGGEWQMRLASRPPRPHSLSDGAWRYLLANDDPGALAPKAEG